MSPCFVPWMTTSRCLAVDGDGGEARLGRDVVIPDIVVDELEAPRQRAGVGLERHDGIGAAIVAGAKAAVEIRARAGGRQENQAARLVDRDRRPDIGGAGRPPAVAPARRIRVVGALRNRVPGPAQGAGPDIEGAHDAARRVDPLVVVDRRAEDDEVADDGGGRSELELVRPEERLAGIDADHAILAETGAWAAVLKIEGDQPEVRGRGQDPLGARPGRA